jgi:hypothetical protein
MVNIKDTVKKLQKKMSPKKSKSPRNVICKVKNPPNNDMIYIIYVKLTNHLPITRSENDGLSKYDFAGVFTTEKDAKYVAKMYKQDIFMVSELQQRLQTKEEIQNLSLA